MSVGERPKMTLRDYWRVIVRRSWIVIVAIIATAAPAIALSLQQEPVYSADADMLIRPLPGESVFGSDQQNINADRRCRTRSRCSRATWCTPRSIENLGLDDDPPGVTGSSFSDADIITATVAERRPANGGHAGQRVRAGLHRREARTDRQGHGRRRQRTADQDHRDPEQDRRRSTPGSRRAAPTTTPVPRPTAGCSSTSKLVPRTHRPAAGRRRPVGRQRRTGATSRCADRPDRAHTGSHGDARRTRRSATRSRRGLLDRPSRRLGAQRRRSRPPRVRCAVAGIDSKPAGQETAVRCRSRRPTHHLSRAIATCEPTFSSSASNARCA